ncbi:hypothetical protein [Terriglobus sp.]|uniref:hypothetical protein n=1 Tax=Terriglobus sp. TaxID=1889013 RepID=UPI003B007472
MNLDGKQELTGAQVGALAERFRVRPSVFRDSGKRKHVKHIAEQTKEQIEAAMAALDSLPDDEIDFCDIPPISDDAVWTPAKPWLDQRRSRLQAGSR